MKLRWFPQVMMLLFAWALVSCGGETTQDPTQVPVIVATPAFPPVLATVEQSQPADESAASVEGLESELTEPYPVPTRVILEPPAAYPPPAIPSPEPASSADLSHLEVELLSVVEGLDTPIRIAQAGDGSERLFILEKKGVIRMVRNGMLDASPFLDIQDRVGSSGSEQGLLGLAFSPRFSEDGFFYVNYTDSNGRTVISRFSAENDRQNADPASETAILTQDQPAENHNGGHLAFGPDGYLYIGLGDGGGAGDRFGNGQNGKSWLGAVLRIDVSQNPYVIPADNPFVSDPDVLDEIWAIGLRNPWAFSFDRLTGDLFIADVGQNQWEEVDFQAVGGTGGENYGWPIMEGAKCYPDQNAVCDQDQYVLPLVEYDHSLGCSITGGYVYRGEQNPALAGVYLFGDYCSGRIWGLTQTQAGVWELTQLVQANIRISSFGEDEKGELYLVAMDSGTLYQILAQLK